MMRQRKQQSEVLKSTDDSYSDMSSANEVANPLCECLYCVSSLLVSHISDSRTDTGTRVNPAAGKFDEPDSRDSWRQSNDGF